MKQYDGIAAFSVPDPQAPDFTPRLRNMLSTIDIFLRDASFGFARIQQGQVPSGSGTPIATIGDLTDYLRLSGRAGGQVAFGGTQSADALTLRGSAAGTFSGSFATISNGSSLLTLDSTALQNATQFLLDLQFKSNTSAVTLFRMRETNGAFNAIELGGGSTNGFLNVRNTSIAFFSVGPSGTVVTQTNTGNPAFIVSANSGATSNPFEVQNASSVAVLGVGKTGATVIKPSADVLPLKLDGANLAASNIFEAYVAGPTLAASLDTSGNFLAFGLALYDSGGSGRTGSFTTAALSASRVYTLPNFGGTVVIDGNSASLTLGIGTTLTASTASSGASFVDTTTSSKKLRAVLSGATGNNSLTLTNANDACDFNLKNYGGLVPIVGANTGAAARSKIVTVDATNQGATIGSTNMTSSASAGYYVVNYTLEDTTADVTAGTIQFQVNYTDDIGATSQTGAALAMTATGRDRGSFQVYLASGELSYQTNVTGIFGTAKYALRVRVTYLG